jgi:hypothetical protein
MNIMWRMRNGRTVCSHVLYNMLCFHLTPPQVIARKGSYNDSPCTDVYFKLSDYLPVGVYIICLIHFKINYSETSIFTLFKGLPKINVKSREV